MPLTQDEKASIAMGDKICDEKISEEASSRIKKDMLIDAKINKLNEQINNLSNSKLYTKVLPDPIIETKATEVASSSTSSIAAEIESLKAAIKDLKNEIDRLSQINSTQEQNSNEALEDAGKRAGDALSGGVDILAKVNKYKDYQFTIDLMESDTDVRVLNDFDEVIYNFPQGWETETGKDHDQMVFEDEAGNNLNYLVQRISGNKYGIVDPHVVSYVLNFYIKRDKDYKWSINNNKITNEHEPIVPDFYYTKSPKDNIRDPYSESIYTDLFITKYYNDSGKLQTSVLEFFPQEDSYWYKYLVRDRLKAILPKNDPKLTARINNIGFPTNNPNSGYVISRSLKETVWFNEGSPYNVLYTDEVKVYYLENETRYDLFERTKTNEWNKKGTTTPLRTRKLKDAFDEFFNNGNLITGKDKKFT